MKVLFTLLTLIIISINIQAQTDSLVCKCAPIIKETTTWVKSKKGNKYCEVVSSSRSIYRKYKKYFGSKPAKPANRRKEWVQKSRGRAKGEWYQRKIKVTSK